MNKERGKRKRQKVLEKEKDVAEEDREGKRKIEKIRILTKEIMTMNLQAIQAQPRMHELVDVEPARDTRAVQQGYGGGSLPLLLPS